MIDLDSIPTIVARYQRAQRRIGGSKGTKADVPRLIVIHDMESGRGAGVAAANALWQRDVGGYAGEQVSSHFAVDSSRAWRCVSDEAVAFTQSTPWNDMALSIEQAGRAAQTVAEWRDALGAPQLELVAQIVAAWSVRWGIPLRYVLAAELARTWQFVSGVTTHYQITLASQTTMMRSLGYKAGSHTDPGAGYPMGELIERAAAILTPVIVPTPAQPSPVVPQTQPVGRVPLYTEETAMADPYRITSPQYQTQLLRWPSGALGWCSHAEAAKYPIAVEEGDPATFLALVGACTVPPVPQGQVIPT
jgi:hypothetical protein